MSECWTEVKRTSEGVSITLYREGPDGRPDVVDEQWWTWPEFLQTEIGDLLGLDKRDVLGAPNTPEKVQEEVNDE